jgi:ribosomal protein S18 acetylase RimI-like enzyme
MLQQLEILSECAFTDLRDPPWETQDFEQILEKGGHGWVATNSETPDQSSIQACEVAHETLHHSAPELYMGYILLQDCVDFIDILKIATHPHLQNQGIASQLLQTALKHSEKRFTLEVAENNYKALTLYQKHGFQRIGVRKGYYKNKASPNEERIAINAIILEKKRST